MTTKSLLLICGANLLGKFSRCFFSLLILQLLIPLSITAQTTSTPSPQISPVPTQYRYPSLVCGKPLPVPSTTAWNKLKNLYKDCIASDCHQEDKYSASTVKNIATEVFQEPAAFIEKHEDIKSGYTIFCAFFGGDNLEYVNCNYILSTVENTHEDNSCRVGNIEDEYTPVFGPNKATFVIEQRIVPLSKIPSLLGQYQTRGQTFVDQSHVQKLLFVPRKRFPGLIEGPVKVQMLQNLNCESLTPTQSRTLENIEVILPSDTVIEQETESANIILQEAESSSLSATKDSASTTISVTPSYAETETSSNSNSITTQETTVSTSILTLSQTPSLSNHLACSGATTQADTAVSPLSIGGSQAVPVLCWELSRKDSVTMVWSDAKNYCMQKSGGWRLPDIYELYALYLQRTVLGGDLDTYWFWSSTPVPDNSDSAWNVYFRDGRDGYDDMSYNYRIRCVCSGSNCLSTANWKAETGVYKDATNQTGRYKVEDRVVTDTFTNLQWKQAHSTTPMLWSDANSYCANSTSGGHQGWRVPTVQELQSLVDYTIPYKGSIAGINDTAFPYTPLNAFWSATPMAGGSLSESWYVTYGKDACSTCFSGMIGSQKWWTLSSNGYVRCVYGNVIPPVTNDRYDNTSAANVVKDLVTGLMWERYASNTMPWQSAITYCRSQNTGGFSGWRVPAVKELSTILNYNINSYNLMMNQEIFAGEPVTWYWSSTLVSDNPSYVWYVNFDDGRVNDNGLGNSDRVRCVCSGFDCRPIPIANWKAETGVYEDATNQTGRYKVEDGVVTDTFTNLQWEQANSTTPMFWSNANNYCVNRNTGGHQGWRLPVVQELQSLVDYTIDWKGTLPGINGTAFPKTSLDYFWSATSVVGYPGRYRYVSYGKDTCFAGLIYAHMTDLGWTDCAADIGYVRCVYGNVIPQVINNRYDNTSIANVVKDLDTGLMWERQASSSTMPWQNANTYCTTQTTGRFSGWRLPSVKELSTLLNYNITPGKLIMDQEVFSGEPVIWYWSASVVSGYPSYAWFVDFGSGYVYSGGMSYRGRVRCVCYGSDCFPIPITNWKAETGVYADATNQTERYRVEDGVVTDTFSNLQWEQANSTTPMPWSDANSYCTNRISGGHSGWRLPTVRELQSLVDYTIDWKGPIAGINSIVFPNMPTDKFWSQTQMAGGTPIQSWFMSFGKDSGYAGLVYSSEWNNYGSDSYSVRCVRGDNSTITNRYDTSTTGIIKDKLTGLWWEKTSGSISTWYNLQSYCSGRNTSGINVWRPPTVKELSTLVDYAIPPGSLTTDAVFSGEPVIWYWSSTMVSGSPGFAWLVNFNSGRVYGNDLSDGSSVRCCCGL